jgi:4-amino-4-deoxy-L-arabinose transferase-like glycosyltransferase
MTADRRGLLFSLAITVGLAGVLDTIVAVRMGRTLDEGAHVRYGRRVLHGEPIRDRIYFDSKMPVSALNAIPGAVGEQLKRRQLLPRAAALLRDWKVARAASVLNLLLLNMLVYRWAAAIYGTAAGLAAAVLVVLAPNLIAHGTLATTDGYFALAVLLALYFLRRYLRQPTATNAALSALTLALAQLTKPIALYLYPIAGLGLTVALLRRPRTEHLPTPREASLYSALCVLAFVLTLNIGFGLYRSFLPLAEYEFTSRPFQQLQQRVSHTPLLRELPVPVPYAYLEGLDMTIDNETQGRSFGNVYLLGELRSSKDQQFKGFKSYYAVAWFFKEPVALQLLLLLRLVELRRRRPFADVMFGEGLLLLAAGGLVAYLSFFNRAQIGIRHILPALAIAVVIGAGAFARFPSLPRWRQIGLGLLVVWLAVSTMRYYPHLIPYMNEWAGDRRLAYRLLADSNLDWGQNEPLVRDFLARNPDVVLNPGEPVCGRVLMSANRLTGVTGTPRNGKSPAWAWSYEPVAHVGYAHFLFDIRTDSAGAGPCTAVQRAPS